MSIVPDLAPVLPGLRRYARALAGSQQHGDALVAATLAAIIDNRALMPAGMPARLALFRAFQLHMAAVPPAAPVAMVEAATADPKGIATARLARLTPPARQALLLGAMEGFAAAEIAVLIDQPVPVVLGLVAAALDEIAHQTRAHVLIIEDEPVTALDIRSLVETMGHQVIGIASTAAQALALDAANPPELVLADIQLRGGTSGLEAVRRIGERHPVPAIFITGHPERFLTGQRPEPAFLITKPFAAAAVQAAIAQALFLAPMPA